MVSTQKCTQYGDDAILIFLLDKGSRILRPIAYIFSDFVNGRMFYMCR